MGTEIIYQEDRELIAFIKSKVLRTFGFMQFSKIYESDAGIFIVFLPYKYVEGWEYADTLEIVLQNDKILFYTTKDFLLIPGGELGLRSDLSSSIAKLVAQHSDQVKELRRD